jgi:2-amino-4-hydroxy-6-hydroxymethyldihydropteridine diphosphokinase
MLDASKKNIAIALGSNMGNRLEFLRTAVQELALYVQVAQISSVYETAPAYVLDQPAFLNAVLFGTTSLEPLALLWMLKDLESTIGRVPTFRYGPRVIDIDLLFHGDTVMANAELILPHPRMNERDFVLRPLADILPDWRHPINGQTVTEMLSALPDNEMSCLGKVL